MRHNSQAEDLRFAVLVALLAACFLMGGASRADVISLILLQPFAAICATVFLIMPGPRDWRAVRTPLLLLSMLGGIMAAQLIPLPPTVWTELPGHGAFAQSATAAGMGQPWRPMSLSPDLTLASLVGLVVPLAVLLGFASIGARHRPRLLTVIIIGSAVSAMFGLAQVSGGEQSPLYLYRITNLGLAVGLFSNRNHEALLIAMTWPMLVAWAMVPRRDRRRRVATCWVAAGFAMFLFPLLLVTGSRAGLILGLIALGCAGLAWQRGKGAPAGPKAGLERYVISALGVAGAVLIAATIFLSRDQAVQRMLNLSAGDDARIEATPVLIGMARDFVPVGSGFGSFDPVFRYYEPSSMLGPQYLNHAHNDLLELAITAGMPGIVLVMVFLAWLVRQSIQAWRSNDTGLDVAIARTASVMIVLTMMSSLVDYPLRTPLIMAIVAVACGWLGTLSRERDSSASSPKALYE